MTSLGGADGRRQRLRGPTVLLPALAGLAAALAFLRLSLAPSACSGHAFLGSSAAGAVHGRQPGWGYLHRTRGRVANAHITRQVYDTILRRDPTMNGNMQRFIKQQLKLVYRQTGGQTGGGGDDERKWETLKRLGLADKIKKPRPWHLDHLKPGDIYRGWFEHPGVNKGDRVKIELVVSDDDVKVGTWKSEDGMSLKPESVKISQDFPVETEKGMQRNKDIAAYLFHKFNMKWRDFRNPLPSGEELEHIDLRGLRIFFDQVAQVEYPSEEEFNEVCSDPSKGMHMSEFLDWIMADQPDYLEETVIGFYTGRRFRVTDGDLQLDGDFQDDVPGLIAGYAEFQGAGEGLFVLQLAANEA